MAQTSLANDVKNLFDTFEIQDNYCPVECFRALLSNTVLWGLNSPYTDAGLTKKALEAAPNPRLLEGEFNGSALENAKQTLLGGLKMPEGEDALIQILEERPDLRDRLLRMAFNSQFGINPDSYDPD